MTVLPVTEQVDEHIAVPTRPVIARNAHHLNDRLGIVSIDVEHEALRDFADVRAVCGAAGVEVVRGEADLVVDDEVQGAADAVAVELRHLGNFVDDALAGDGRIAMNENGQNGRLAALRPLDDGA